MPIYEYKCLRCGYLFEELLKLQQSAPTCCPRCGGPIRKQLSPPAIQFKGTGWYITDYAGRKPKDKKDFKEKKPSSETSPSSKESPSVSPEKKASVSGK